MRRTGHLEKVPEYLEKAEKASQRGTTEPGLAFCKALYEWWVQSALPRAACAYFGRELQLAAGGEGDGWAVSAGSAGPILWWWRGYSITLPTAQ